MSVCRSGRLAVWLTVVGLSVCRCVGLSVRLAYRCRCVGLSVWPSSRLAYRCRSVSLSVCRSVGPSGIPLSVCRSGLPLSVCRSVRLPYRCRSDGLSVCRSIGLAVWLTVLGLSICPSVWLTVLGGLQVLTPVAREAGGTATAAAVVRVLVPISLARRRQRSGARVCNSRRMNVSADSETQTCHMIQIAHPIRILAIFEMIRQYQISIRIGGRQITENIVCVIFG